MESRRIPALTLSGAFQLLVLADLHALLHSLRIVIPGAAAVGTAVGFERGRSGRRTQEGFDLSVNFPGSKNGCCITTWVVYPLPGLLQVLSEASAFLQRELRAHTHIRLCVCI